MLIIVKSLNPMQRFGIVVHLYNYKCHYRLRGKQRSAWANDKRVCSNGAAVFKRSNDIGLQQNRACRCEAL